MVNLINKQDPETGVLTCNRWCINGICESRVAKFIDGIGYCIECSKEVELDKKIRRARKKLYR